MRPLDFIQMTALLVVLNMVITSVFATLLIIMVGAALFTTQAVRIRAMVLLFSIVHREQLRFRTTLRFVANSRAGPLIQLFWSIIQAIRAELRLVYFLIRIAILAVQIAVVSFLATIEDHSHLASAIAGWSRRTRMIMALRLATMRRIFRREMLILRVMLRWSWLAFLVRLRQRERQWANLWLRLRCCVEWTYYAAMIVWYRFLLMAHAWRNLVALVGWMIRLKILRMRAHVRRVVLIRFRLFVLRLVLAVLVQLGPFMDWYYAHLRVRHV